MMEAVKASGYAKPVTKEGIKIFIFCLSLSVILLFALRGFLKGFKLLNWPDAMLFILVSALLVYLRRELEKRRFKDREKVLPAVYIAEYICILTALSGLGLLAQYGAVWNRPLVMNDKFLMRLDSLFFGFNWFKFNSLVVSSPVTAKAAGIIYGMITPFTLILTILLIKENKEDEAVKFIIFMAVTLAVTVIAFYIYPAVGPVKNGSGIKSIIDPYYQPSIMAASAGKGAYLIGAQSLDGAKAMQISGTYAARGAICLPSYHAVLAFGYMYFSKNFSVPVRTVFTVVSLLMCIAAVPAGNHFLVDILAGWAVALSGIFLIPQNTDFLIKTGR